MTKTGVTQLIEATHRLQKYCIEEALPLWSTAARDPDGGYYEDLDLTGQPRTKKIRRTRIQPRQAYAFAHAHLLGWCDQAQQLSDHGFDYLLSKASHGDPFSSESFAGFAHTLCPDGQIADPRCDTYDHAFVLLACAWRIKAFKDERAEDLAKSVVAFLERAVGMPDGSYQEGVPANLPRRQNPHMHLFEAFMALFDATNDAAYAEHAKALFSLFKNRFWDPQAGVLREFFTEDWELDPNLGNVIEPGHMMEWCWLLNQYSNLFGEEVGDVINRLFTNAEKLGLDHDSRFLADKIYLSDEPPAPLTRRMWVQTEYIRACLVQTRRFDPGDTQEEMARKASMLLEQFSATYLNAGVKGGYNDQYGLNGRVISTAIPTSTLYHLMGMAAEAVMTADFVRND
ncbi:MAG: AGE family epimerase/isomerase [Pseudomonadota bacterium]